MKKYPGILKRAELVDWRSGRVYAKPDGTLFKSLFVLSSLLILYTFFINLFYVLGLNIIYQDTKEYKQLLFPIVSVAVANALLIASFILMKLKRRVVSAILAIIPSSFLIVFFGFLSKAEVGEDSFLGFLPLYFWRHFIPLFFILLFSIWMIAIIVRAKRKFNRVYKETEELLYSLYKENNPNASEADWVEFATNYEGNSPQKLFPKKKKGKNSNTEEDANETENE